MTDMTGPNLTRATKKSCLSRICNFCVKVSLYRGIFAGKYDSDEPLRVISYDRIKLPIAVRSGMDYSNLHHL